MTVCKTIIRCGDTLHVLVASCEAELSSLATRMTAKLLRPGGHAVEAADGSAIWISDEQIHPSVWSGDGNKVLANRFKFSRDAGGTVSKETIKRVWVSP